MLRLLSYNIDWARREEQLQVPEEQRHQHLLIKNRLPGIIDTIAHSGATIANVQELRALDSCETKPADFVALVNKRCGYHCLGPFYYCKDAVSFALCTFYRRDLYHVLQLGLIGLPPLNPQTTRVCLWVLFQCAQSGRRFIVANTHLDLDEQVKQVSLAILATQLRQLVVQYGAPLVLTGDFNLFDDLQGGAQRQWMLDETASVDVFHPLHLARESETVLSGTFIGYPETDAHAKTPETMSRLDHAFLFGPAGLEPQGHAYTVDVTMGALRAARLSSDHLPCVREFALRAHDTDEQ